MDLSGNLVKVAEQKYGAYNGIRQNPFFKRI